MTFLRRRGNFLSAIPGSGSRQIRNSAAATGSHVDLSLNSNVEKTGLIRAGTKTPGEEATEAESGGGEGSAVEAVTGTGVGAGERISCRCRTSYLRTIPRLVLHAFALGVAQGINPTKCDVHSVKLNAKRAFKANRTAMEVSKIDKNAKTENSNP